MNDFLTQSIFGLLSTILTSGVVGAYLGYRGSRVSRQKQTLELNIEAMESYNQALKRLRDELNNMMKEATECQLELMQEKIKNRELSATIEHQLKVIESLNKDIERLNKALEKSFITPNK